MNKALVLGLLTFFISICTLTAQQAPNDRGKATEVAPPALTLTTLANFGGSNGSRPVAGVVQGIDGSFYGTTAFGGANDSGTVFKVTPSGKLITLYSFWAQLNCPGGSQPTANLIQATDENFYGTTQYGSEGGVFKITPSGTLTTYDLCTSGWRLYAGLVQATDGNFYGTTGAGGTLIYGVGTVFKITHTGTLTTLYSFCVQSPCPDGVEPYTSLVQATDGNFYGTTYLGGANNSSGTVFKITPQGSLTTLYSFCAQSACTDGYGPVGLVQATDAATILFSRWAFLTQVNLVENGRCQM